MTAKWAWSRAAASSCLPSLRRPSSARAAIPAARRSVATAQPGHGVVRVGADDDRHRAPAPAAGAGAGLGQGEDEPVEADPEADAGRRPAAEQLDQAVVAAAAAERLLLALAAGDVELERGPGVVVEAADEPRLQPVRDAERVEVRADGREVLGAGVAQAVGDLAAPRR